MTIGPPAAPSAALAGKFHKPGDLVVGFLGQIHWRHWGMVTSWPEGKKPMADEQWKPDGVDQDGLGMLRCPSAP